MTSSIIPKAPSGCCFSGFKHEGIPVGQSVAIGGMETYISEPASPTARKILIFFADVFGPFYLNNQLLQDYFASNGFTVLGPDYFFGDPIHKRTEPDFDRKAWVDKSKQRADEVVPGWIEAVKEKYGTENTTYTAVGYCFGGSYAINAGSMDLFAAVAFAHPAFLTDAHFEKLKRPLMLSCAEIDHTFPMEFRRRAEDILVANKAVYYIQVFSQVSHGFATRSDPADPHARWCKEESARGILRWFKRFSV